MTSKLEKAIAEIFQQSNMATVLQELNRYGLAAHEREHERVCLAILSLSEGSLDKLKELVELAKRDYRDILMWAEYPESQAESEAVLLHLAEWLKEQGKPDLAQALIDKVRVNRKH